MKNDHSFMQNIRKQLHEKHAKTHGAIQLHTLSRCTSCIRFYYAKMEQVIGYNTIANCLGKSFDAVVALTSRECRFSSHQFVTTIHLLFESNPLCLPL